MLKKENERKHKGRGKIYAARDFSDKYYLVIFKYPIIFVKLLNTAKKIDCTY
jgi:hypothetical protein